MAKNKSSKKGGAKRPPQKANARESKAITWLIVAIGILIVLIVVIFVALMDNSSSQLQQDPGGRTTATTMPAIDGMTCDSMEGSVFHVHSHLAIYQNGTSVTVPANIGIYADPGCFYWMHTHDDTGELHMEAPQNRTFTLGNFFDVWKQQLSKTQVMNFSNNGQDIKIYVDGKPYTGDPRQIVMKSHTKVLLEVGPKFVDPSVDTYTFPGGD